MKRILLLSAFCLLLGNTASGLAQNLTITNARIIAGNGDIIENGSIIVRDGRIISLAAGAPQNPVGTVIDANGMSAMPGFIDAHRHVNSNPDEGEQMQALLEAGYTTVLSGGGPAEGGIALRDHIESGQINGPRIIPSGRVSLSSTPEEARAEIRRMASMGIKVHRGDRADLVSRTF